MASGDSLHKLFLHLRPPSRPHYEEHLSFSLLRSYNTGRCIRTLRAPRSIVSCRANRACMPSARRPESSVPLFARFLHHGMVRGIARRRIFHDRTDRADFVARLAAVAESGALPVSAWALLPNHAHLLVRTGSRPLGRVMRSLHLNPLRAGGVTKLAALARSPVDRPQRATRARRPSLAGAPGAPLRHDREADAGDERILGGSEFVEERRWTLDTEGRVWYKN